MFLFTTCNKLTIRTGCTIFRPRRNAGIFVDYWPVRWLLISCQPVKIIYSIPVIAHAIKASLMEVFVKMHIRPVVRCKLHWWTVFYDCSTSHVQVEAGTLCAMNTQLLACDYDHTLLTVVDKHWSWCGTTQNDTVSYQSDMNCARRTLNYNAASGKWRQYDIFLLHVWSWQHQYFVVTFGKSTFTY